MSSGMSCLDCGAEDYTEHTTRLEVYDTYVGGVLVKTWERTKHTEYQLSCDNCSSERIVYKADTNKEGTE